MTNKNLTQVFQTYFGRLFRTKIIGSGHSDLKISAANKLPAAVLSRADLEIRYHDLGNIGEMVPILDKKDRRFYGGPLFPPVLPDA